MKSVNRWIVAGLAVLASGIGGCGTGTEGTKTAESCTEIDLEGVCPTGTSPKLDAAATASCDSSAAGSGSQGATGEASAEGSLDHVCRSKGSCQVRCEIFLVCEFGFREADGNRIECKAKEEANSCGDGHCLPPENPESCRADCERECDVNDTSCDGVKLRTCSPKGLWSSADCEPGTQCTVEGGAAACTLIPAVCVPGETQCNGDAKQTCTDLGQWGASVPCPSGQTCDPATARCVSSCAPGATSCNGTALRTCSPQGEWVEAACEAGTHCTEDAGTASCTAIPAVCEAGATQCNGDAVQICNGLGQWAEPVGCPSEQRCDVDSNECVNAGIDPACDQFCTSCFVTYMTLRLNWLANDGSPVEINSYDTCVRYVCGDADEATAPWVECCNRTIGEHNGLCRGDILDEACP
jgi:hypothetical protein